MPQGSTRHRVYSDSYHFGTFAALPHHGQKNTRYIYLSYIYVKLDILKINAKRTVLSSILLFQLVKNNTEMIIYGKETKLRELK